MNHHYGWLLIATILCIHIQQLYAELITPFSLDTNLLGNFGIVGQFAGLSPYNNTLQTATPSPGISIYQKNDVTSIFSSLIVGDGKLYASCILDQQLYIGGTFTTLLNKNNNSETVVNNIARWDLSLNQLYTLEQGLDGPVYSLYCDKTNNTVYIGGDFHQPIGINNNNSASFAGKVVQWYNNQWLPLPWQGFNGPVHVITHNPTENTLLFAGQFDSTGDGFFFNMNTSHPVNLDNPTVNGIYIK